MSLKSYDRNPLARFRSYRYYFALAICDTTDTAVAVSESTDPETWLHPNDDSVELGMYSPKSIGEGDGKYCILINGATDAAFWIETCSWVTSVAATTYPGGYGNSILQEGKMRIIEPRGIMLFDQIILCCQALGVDLGTAQILLKPFFVGYTDKESQDQSSHIMTIKPIVVVFGDISGAFTEAGGVYDITFFGSGCGAARLPQFSKVCDGFTLSPKQTLSETADYLTAYINEKYSKYYECMTKYISDTLKDDPSLYVPIEYKVTVDKYYKDPSYRMDEGLSVYKTDPSQNLAAPLKQNVGASLEEFIQQMLSKCKKVLEDSTIGEDGLRFTPVVRPIVTYSKDKVFVEYYIYRVPSAVSGVVDLAKGEKTSALYTQEVLDNNTVEFDYIYTGQNVDVMEFDIRMKDGLPYIMTAISSNSFRDQLQAASSRTAYINPNALATHRTNTPLKIPLYFGTQGRNKVNNSQSAGLNVGHQFTMASQAFYEMSEARLKISGNLSLLENSSLLSEPKLPRKFDEVEQAPTVQPAGDYSPIATHFGEFPLLAKVNIMMPSKQDDLEILRNKLPYSSKFWFDGYYNVFEITHDFISGEFTQTLLMYALPNPEDQKEKEIRERQPDLVTKTPYEACFESIQCDPSGPRSSPTKAPVHTVQPTNPDEDYTTNKPDSDTVVDNSDMSNVKGWAKASPEVKQAIKDAAAKHNVSPSVLASIAAKESSFRPTAKNPMPGQTSSGLYGFTDGTWKETMTKGGMPQYADPKYKTDPKIASEGAALYLKSVSKTIGSNQPGDQYTAWFMGPGHAKKIIAASNAGGDNRDLRDVLGKNKKGADNVDTVYAANPFLKKNGITTVGALRAWAAKSMAGAVTSPTQTPQPSDPNQTTQPAQSNLYPRQQGATAADKIRGAQLPTTIDPSKKQNTRSDKVEQ